MLHVPGLLRNAGLIQKIDHIFDVITCFSTKTRWTRTFDLIHGYPLK